MRITTSLRKKKKRKSIRKSREIETNDLPEHCLSCTKKLTSSIHHFFCDKCWNMIQEKINGLRRDVPPRWCLICGRNISQSDYFYFCNTHGQKIEQHRGKALARKKLKKGTGNVPLIFDFYGSKR